METSKRFSPIQGIEHKGGTCHCPAFSRLGLHAVLLSTLVAFLFAAMFPPVVLAEDDFDSVYDKASLYFRQGKYEDALTQYKKANRLMQDSSLECLWGMAQSFSKLGASRNTMQTCDRMIELSGDNVYFRVKAWNLRGNELSAAAMANPEKPDQNKLQEALTAYREVLKLSSALDMAHYNLGMTLIRMNRVDEGVGELKVYVQNAEDRELVEKAQKIIQNPRRAVENYAPDFSMVTSAGEYISSDDLRGKIVLLDFWGAWCQPCVSAIPFLSGLSKKYRKEPFALISIDVNDEESKWRDFIDKNRMDWTQMRDANNKVSRLFQINAFPSYILIDHEGIIRYWGRGSGMQTENEVSSAVKKALKALASFGNHPEVKSVASTIPVVAAAISESPQKVESKSLAQLEKESLKNQSKDGFMLRMPKPIVELTATTPPNLVSQPPSRMSYYRVQVRNWASFSDDFFQPASNLMPCTIGAMMPRGDMPDTRLEILIMNEQGQLLRGFCNPPQPQMLQSLMLMIPDQSSTGKIYMMLKDRLTGNSVQSDPVLLP